MFSHLHVHSHYSLLESTAKIANLVARAKELGQTHLALTDSGVMYGAVEFYRACRKAGIVPILGMEVFIAPNGRHNKRAHIDEERLTLTLLAQDFAGYQNLVALATSAALEGFYYKPRVDEELLRRHAAGLIALSGDYWGVIADGIRKNRADEMVAKYRDIFGAENFFIEIQQKPKVLSQQQLNAHLFAIAAKHNIPTVATADVHYLLPDDAEAQDILLCIGKKRKLAETNRFSLRGEDYSLKTEAEMRALFTDHPEAVDMAQTIAERCRVELPLGQIRLPHYDTPPDVSAQQYMTQLTEAGLRQRYGENLSVEVRQRADYELGVIEKMGFAPYFLIVQDFINWAKERGIVVGPGRGSAAGSIVSYALGITALDPLAYKLVFERFLNPERISMPDIDVDFADDRRDEVLRYVEGKYGKNRVAQIITFGTMAARAAIRDVGRVMDLSYGYCDRIAKMIPMFTGLTEALEKSPELHEAYEKEPDAKSLIDNARRLEGVARHASIHACGVVIAADPLVQLVPTQHAPQSDDVIISEYDMHAVEDLGLLKMDFLGLANLSIIEKALQIIAELHGEKVDINTIPLDDKKTLQLFRTANTTGVFQFESTGMKRYLRQLKPGQLEDVIAMVALYRPGPMDLIPSFIDRKNGREQISYLHPKLESILKNTYGIAVYQEQVLQISRELAGFTYGEADVLRKAVGKKIASLLAEQRIKFIEGCVKSGHSRQLGEQLFSFIEPFARYGFNRAHAACYAFIGYQTAYLKAHYPAEFMAALLTSDQLNTDRVMIEVDECRNMGILVLPPDINESIDIFTVVKESLAEKKPRIRFGLRAIKNVGDGVVSEIISERKRSGSFKTLEEFLRRIPSRDLNKKSLESLVKAGALDSLGERGQLLQHMDAMLGFHKKSAEAAASNQKSLFSALGSAGEIRLTLLPTTPADKKTRLAWEKELLGLYVSEHPFSDIAPLLPTGRVLPLTELKTSPGRKRRVAVGILTAVDRVLTHKGEYMLFAKLEDTTSSLDVLIFPSLLSKTPGDVFVEGNCLVIAGKLNDKDGVTKMLADAVDILNIQNPVATLDNLESGDAARPAKKQNYRFSVDDQTKEVTLTIPFDTKRETLHQLKEIFARYPGELALYLELQQPDGQAQRIKTKSSIANTPGLVQSLTDILSPEDYGF